MSKDKYNYIPLKPVYGRRVYIGNKDGEEFFIEPIEWSCNWYWGGVYLSGLRPETEETIKYYMRETEPEDLGFDIPQHMENYFNRERWKDDYEEEWYNHHDVQETQERDSEEYYLGFGCHTHTDTILLKECKGNYKEALKVFDKIVFSKEEFEKLIKLLKRLYSHKEQNQNTKKYLTEMKKAEETLKELEDFLGKFSRLPTKEYWTKPEV